MVRTGHDRDTFHGWQDPTMLRCRNRPIRTAQRRLGQQERPSISFHAATPHNGSMPNPSAGILLYRRTRGELEVFLIHPGGPFWAKKDAWSIPKGEYDPHEPPLAAARREFQEETGSALAAELPDDRFMPLGFIRQRSGKEVTAWAVEGDFDPATLVSNTCSVEWPPRSGRQVEIPEADRGAWFTVEEARKKIFRGQELLLDRLVEALG
jgi:predicted NUDIX family NTP pyrophosphohydrolase